MTNIFIINGPNLNMLGMREPEIYGTQTHEDIVKLCTDTGAQYGCKILVKQSNHEGVIIDLIQETAVNKNINGLIINAGAYTHTSIAIHDALKLLTIPIIEVHLSDPEKREEFRHISYITPLAKAVIKGKGAAGYVEAIEMIAKTTHH